jgi:predicted DNA-binding protein (MmcQ/YjbR family)
MSLSWVRSFCLQLPGATEELKWEHLAFCIGGKIFAIQVLEPDTTALSFKCTPEAFAELTERPFIIQAPYCARGQWVALERPSALPRHELEPLLRQAYELILRKLPKKKQAEFTSLMP